MEQKEIPENEQNDKKSWLEEQLQKRNIHVSDEKFTFKEEENAEIENTSQLDSTQNTQTIEPQKEVIFSQNTETHTSAENEVDTTQNEVQKQEEVHTSAENEIDTTQNEVQKQEEVYTSAKDEINTTQNEVQKQEDIQNKVENKVKEVEQTSKQTYFQKISKFGQKKIFGEVTVKKALPYGVGGILLMVLLFNMRYVVFDESDIPNLQNVNVKDTLLSDISVTKVLDPQNPDKNDNKTNKKEKKTTNPENKQANEINNQRIYYRVKTGDRFNDIARKHGLTPAELKELNPKVRPDRIRPGQKLRVKKLD